MSMNCFSVPASYRVTPMWKVKSQALLPRALPSHSSNAPMGASARADAPMGAFELWLGKARGKSACDFTFHMGVTRYDAGTEKQFIDIVKRGVSSFKIFLAYK